VSNCLLALRRAPACGKRDFAASRGIRGGTNLPVVLIAPHNVTQREEHAREQQHQHEQADDMPALQNALSGAPSFPPDAILTFAVPLNS